jgi:glycosyltransferase involved in cell wall biosynthesis
MPCLNEAETIGIVILKAKQWIKAKRIKAEIVVADNGSSDGSQAIANRLGARVVDVRQKGYGSALFSGCMAAKGKYIIMGDSDDSYDFSKLDPFIEKFDEGYELVMGNRFKGNIKPGAMPWKNRYIGNPILSLIGRLFFPSAIGDFHCGIRGVTRKAFLRMDLRTTGMEFASEMVIKATLFNMRIAEVPVTLSKDGRSRPPHLRPWRDGWRHLRFMLLLSPRWFFLMPGLFLFISSLFIYGLLIRGPLQVGGIIFDIHTLFFIEASLVIGLLAILCGLIIKAIGIREGLFLNDTMLEKIRNSPVLEYGGLVGIALSGLGIYYGLFALNAWKALNFGALNQDALLRYVSLSSSLILIGGVIVLWSMIMGFLTLPTRDQRL